MAGLRYCWQQQRPTHGFATTSLMIIAGKTGGQGEPLPSNYAAAENRQQGENTLNLVDMLISCLGTH